MSVVIRKAERKKAKLRLGIAAPTGAGKTFSSLLIASGIGPKVGLIDTENGSGDLYADSKKIKDALPGGYDIINISAPYDPKKYIEAITAFEDASYDVVIIDSLSHAWAGSGGLLDKQGKEADRSGNSYTAWRTVTPQHNALVDKILQSPCHIIATMRSKTEHVQEKNEQGKTIVRKIGMAPVMRDGIEYEFTVFGEIDQTHHFHASKDRTDTLKDVFVIPSKQMGAGLLEWLESGKEPEKSLDQLTKEFIEAMNVAPDAELFEKHIKDNALFVSKLANEKPGWHKDLIERIDKRRSSYTLVEAAE